MFELYGHPFSLFTWKPLIALHEREVDFSFRQVDPGHPDNQALLKRLSPTGQFPVLLHAGREIVESNVIIEYLDLYAGDRPPMVPQDSREALEARMMADIFDDYISSILQRIVEDALSAEADRSAPSVARAKGLLDQSYDWLERKMAGRKWAAGDRFGLADCAAAPALFYADWTHPIPDSCPELRAFRARLLARPSIMRVIDDARPYRRLFPLGAPDRD